MGKKRVITEENLGNLNIPFKKNVYGIDTKLFGYDRVLGKCQDEHERICFIMSKIKRRVWNRLIDVVLVSLWYFQTAIRGDLIWRYTRDQANNLRQRELLTIS